MPAAFQFWVILITVECYFFFEYAKCRAHSHTHVLMFEYANLAYANDISGEKINSSQK